MYLFSLSFVVVQAFNPDNEYHFKNRMKACQRNWAEVFGEEANMFAVSPSNTYQKVRDYSFIWTHPVLLLLWSFIWALVPIFLDALTSLKTFTIISMHTSYEILFTV